MADITSFNQGQVSAEGKTNWRGDQVTVTPGNQSIFDSSSVPLAELGMRKVVGDRVFRYCKANGAIGAGEVAQMNLTSLINVTAGTNPYSAGVKKLNFYFATSNSAGVYDEGSVFCQSGTAANTGITYRIKSQPIVATTSVATLELFDEVKITPNVADKYSVFSNPYSGLTQNTAGTAPPACVPPIAVTAGDYFWGQTWGPCAVKGSAVGAAAHPVAAGATGQVQDAVVATTAAPLVVVGHSMQIMTASEKGLVFLSIAP